MSEDELDGHIRFEERELFIEIQQKADPDTLKRLRELHDDLSFKESKEDKFWNVE